MKLRIQVEINWIDGRQAGLSFEAPQEVKIFREELLE
ncbi:MAG: carbon storage regulator [Candidatus Sedimenticola endophacoides]